MSEAHERSGVYVYREDDHSCAFPYLSGPILRWVREIGAKRVLDLGCGSGEMTAALAALGCEVVGLDPEESAVAQARARVPSARIIQAGVYDDPASLNLGTFDAVVSTEVIEHLFLPRALPQFARSVLNPGGSLMLSTPYFGWLKNVGIAASGRWDAVHSPLWDGGHVKFWSRGTLTALLTAGGFTVTGFAGVGRVPFLWKSMILTARLREGIRTPTGPRTI